MKKIILTLALAVAALSVFAAEFVDKSASSKVISFGVRFGYNTSGQHASLNGLPGKKDFDWGSGWTAGAVIDLNVRNYFSIQPGIFYENRSFDYSIIDSNRNTQSLNNTLGHARFNSFTIPILASFKFNISNAMQWVAEAGPYFAFGLGGDEDIEEISTLVSSSPDTPSSYKYQTYKRDYYGDNSEWQHKKFHWGLKIGTGLKFLRNFSAMIHYQMGLKNISKHPDWSVKERNFSVSLGYDF